jgi:hypothetical protein
LSCARQTARVFKTAWFAKAAKKARTGDPELCAAIREVQRGQADDLGGGVFKKRLDDNMHRSLVLAKVVGTGYMRICSRRRTEPISRPMNSWGLRNLQRRTLA